MKSTVIVGLDLSLTCTGFVSAPTCWDGDWAVVSAREFAASTLPKLARGEERQENEYARTQRIAVLARSIVRACAADDAKRVVIEQRAFSQHTAASAQVAALTEIVQYGLWELGIYFSCVPSTQARKLLLGKVPKTGKDAKNAVQATFRQAGCPVEWSQDVCDALCVLNHHMSLVGGRFYAGAA